MPNFALVHKAHPKEPEKWISMVTRERLRERIFSCTIGQDQTPTHSLTCSSIYWHLPRCGYFASWGVLLLLPHASRVRKMLRCMSTASVFLPALILPSACIVFKCFYTYMILLWHFGK